MSDTNGLGVSQGGATPGVAAAPAAASPGQTIPEVLSSHHDRLAARASQMDSHAQAIEKIQASLDRLTRLGDSVTPDEVIEQASELVGGGADPVQMASMLADMPSNGGAALAAWLQQKDQVTKQAAGQISGMTTLAKHQAGIAALHSLAAQHMLGAAQAQPGPPPAGPNQLMPAASAAPPPGAPLNAH